jgi:biopolymer transport protein ExbD
VYGQCSAQVALPAAALLRRAAASYPRAVADDEGGGASEALAEINVTPMIDVLLCLLIIFMVATPPPPSHKQEIAMPPETPVETQDDPKATLVVEIEDDGSATLGKTPLPPDYEGMVEEFKKSEKAQQDGKVAIKAGEKVEYGKVITVMAAAREAGIPSVGIASDRL